MRQLTRWVDSMKRRIRDDSVFICTSDTADASVFGRATVHMTKRSGQRRWSSHRREVEDEDGGELHDGTAKSVKQLDEQSNKGRQKSLQEMGVEGKERMV